MCAMRKVFSFRSPYPLEICMPTLPSASFSAFTEMLRVLVMVVSVCEAYCSSGIERKMLLRPRARVLGHRPCVARTGSRALRPGSGRADSAARTCARATGWRILVVLGLDILVDFEEVEVPPAVFHLLAVLERALAMTEQIAMPGRKRERLLRRRDADVDAELVHFHLRAGHGADGVHEPEDVGVLPPDFGDLLDRVHDRRCVVSLCVTVKTSYLPVERSLSTISGVVAFPHSDSCLVGGDVVRLGHLEPAVAERADGEDASRVSRSANGWSLP